MSKRPAFWLVAMVLVGAILALGMHKPKTQTAPKASSQTAADDSVVRETTQNRLCEELKAIEGKLGQIQSSVSSATRVHGEFKATTARIRTEHLTPLFEKRTIATKKTAQVKTGLVPVEQTRKLTQVYGQLRGIKNDFFRIRGTLQAQIADLEKSWGVIDQGLKRVAGLRPAAGTSPSRQCVVQEANRVQGEMATLGTQASTLQAEIEDVNAALDQEFGQGPCSDGAISGGGNCETCCDQYYPTTAPEGSPEASEQNWARFQCMARCAAAAAAGETSSGAAGQMIGGFREFDIKAYDLFQLMARINKDISSKWQDIIRNITR